MIGNARYLAFVQIAGLATALACSGPGREVREQAGDTAGENAETAGDALGERVNRQWPRISLLDQRRAAIDAAMHSLDRMRAPELSVTVSIHDLERLLPDLIRSRLVLPAIEGLDRVTLSELSLSAGDQTLHVATRFELVLSRQGLALSGTVQGAVAVALRGARGDAPGDHHLLLFPVFSQLAIDPIGSARAKGHSDAQVSVISATLQRFVARLNEVALATPSSLSFPLHAVDAVRAVDMVEAQGNLHVTPADRTFVFDAHLGEAAILIDERGVHILAELAAEAGQAATDDSSPPEHMPEPVLDHGPDNAVDPATVDTGTVDPVTVDNAFASLSARFERVRAEHFGVAASPASTRVLMAKPALAAILRDELSQPALCVAHRELALHEKPFRERLRAFRKDQIQCSGARRSCAEECRGRSAPCRVACRARNEARVAACKSARASIGLFNGLMDLGELVGLVDVEGAAELCPRTLEFDDELSTMRVTGRASARAQVTARVRVDTRGIGHLACVFPFTKEFRGEAALDQELTITGKIVPARTADGALELLADITPSPFRVTMKPTPWEQMIDDPRFAVNCTFVTLALPAISLGSALIGKKAPTGVDELTRGVYDVTMPPQRLRLRVRPLRVTLGDHTLLLKPVWSQRFIGFEL